jgi:hypothetical protein
MGSGATINTTLENSVEQAPNLRGDSKNSNNVGGIGSGRSQLRAKARCNCDWTAATTQCGRSRRLTFELSRPWRQGPLADEGNMLQRPWRPVGLAGAGRLERRVRPQRTSIWTKPAVVPNYRLGKRPGVASPTRKDSRHDPHQGLPLFAASDEQPGVATATAEGFEFALSSSRLSGPQWLRKGKLLRMPLVRGRVPAEQLPACREPPASAFSVSGHARQNGVACHRTAPGLPAVTE